MKGAVKLRRNDEDVARLMELYIATLKKEAERDPKLARRRAKRALIRTGVLTPDGKPKKKIVSWE